MTIFGCGFIIVVVFFGYVSVKISRRLNGLLWLVSPLIVSLSIPAYILSVNNINNSIKLFSGNKYEAEVVDVTVSMGKDSATYRGRMNRRTTYYYTPIVEFEDAYGKVQKKSLDKGLYTEPLLGKTITITDRPSNDTAFDVSIAKNPSALFLFLVQSVLLSVLFFFTGYGFGVENSINKSRTKRLLLICLTASILLYAANILY